MEAIVVKKLSQTHTHTAGKDQSQNLNPGLYVFVPVTFGGHSVLWRCWVSEVNQDEAGTAEQTRASPTTTNSSPVQWGSGFSVENV